MPNADPNRTPTAPQTLSLICVLIAVLFLALMVLPGLRWGLPSDERNRLTMGDDRSEWRAPVLPAGERESPWEAYPNHLPGGRQRTGSASRTAFNPVRSYHPDEYVFFKSLSGMEPSRLNFFPGFFGWPALHIYVVGATLKASSLFGIVTLVRDMDFYFRNPAAMARLYEIGRIVTLLFAAGCILVTWRAATRLFGAAGGIAAAFLLAATPLFIMNARYLTADVPMLFWISLVLLFSTHILEGGGRRWYVLAGGALGLAAATRYQGALAALLIAAAHVQSSIVHRPSSIRSRNLWLAAGVSILVFLACNPFILLRPAQFAQEFTGELRSSGVTGLQFLHGLWPFAMTGLGMIYCAAVAAALLLAIARRDRAAMFILFGLGIPALLLLAGRPSMVRYFMPVLLLPVFLIAWAFATIHRRGVEIGKPAALAAAPALLAFLLLFAGAQCSVYSRLLTDPVLDTRTRAGEWIAQSIPAGARIGVFSEPWQFELPPLDGRKYRIVVWDDRIGKGGAFPGEPPDYIAASDLQFPPVGLTGTGSANLSCLWRSMREGGDPGINIARKFEGWPFGQKDILLSGPHDMRYANPVIIIAKIRK